MPVVAGPGNGATPIRANGNQLLAQGRIVEVIAFLDTLAFADIMKRVPCPLH